jgi:hypothetical protein
MMAMFLICILIFFSGHKGRSNYLLKEQANVLLIINYYWGTKMVPPGAKVYWGNGAARDQKGSIKHFCRQGPEGSIIHFLPPGT